MEIPLDNITKQIHENDLKIIKAQAREIRDLQMTICRLKDEHRISNDLRELDKRDGE